MEDLMMIKLTDGKNVLAELEYVDVSYSYILKSPLIVSTSQTEGNETIVGELFMPGTHQENFLVPASYLATYARADELYSMFYGRIMLSFYIQKESQRISLLGQDSFGDFEKCSISMKKSELMKKYGIFGEDNHDLSDKRILH